MYFELFSVALLAGFMWAVAFLLPKAVRKRDGLALIAAVLTMLLALLGWLFLSGGVRSR